MQQYISITEEVQTALHEQKAVVALESTVISHGLPYPHNVEVAQDMENAIRAEGAIPATIGIRDGKIIVGLSTEEIQYLATTSQIQKVSRRDLAVTLARKHWGATTVAGTMLCAYMAGIRFFATGGIGGVHRGAERTMDISADLQELSRTPVMVVCAGAKSILDLNLTLEYMETHGIPVLGWQTDEFPAFYVRSSGHPVPHRVDEVEILVAIARVQWDCNLGGILVGCPIPEQYALQSAYLDTVITEALLEADRQGVKGARITPFVLSRVADVTTGESVEANKALLVNNAVWAARFAHAYYL
ncbi:MAG TPA: pseudouridine-5'-phosphate glycosidase [Dictyobacter sp.]|nr:pseudouridine-5'-phosphate glycosidase [Dictyobacter sp.]